MLHLGDEHQQVAHLDLKLNPNKKLEGQSLTKGKNFIYKEEKEGR